MAGTTEKEKREAPSAPFTDGAYIPRNEAPNMPRVLSNADVVEPSAPERRSVPLSFAGILCILCLFLGLWLGSRYSTGQEAAVAPTAEPSGERGIAAELPVSASMIPRTREDGGERAPGLGVTVQTVSPAAAKYYKLYCADGAVLGVQIYAMEEDSAASRAGLLTGDILTALDGECIRSAAELSDAESTYRAGESAVCTVFRNGETLDIPVVFEENAPEAAGGYDW